MPSLCSSGNQPQALCIGMHSTRMGYIPNPSKKEFSIEQDEINLVCQLNTEKEKQNKHTENLSALIWTVMVGLQDQTSLGSSHWRCRSVVDS